MKKIFTLFALVMMAMGVSAQEVALFDNGGTYGNAATLSTANAQVVLGNDRTTKNYNVKLSSCKAYCAGLFGQTVQVQNEDTGEMEDKTRVVYVVGDQNPKDKELDGGDKSQGSGYKPESGNLPQSGTYYMFTPKKNGHVVSFIILNSGKNFYVVKGSDGTNLPASELILKADGDEATEVQFNEDFTVEEKVTGTIEFDVVANETYYIFCTGSKLSYGGYVFTPEGGESQDLTETTLWEGTAVVDGWANQPGFLADGGAELQAVKAKAGDIIRFYMTAPDNEWEVELTEGHWGGMYVRWAAYDHGGTNEDGSPRLYTVVDLAGKGYADFVMTDEAITNAYTMKYWGNVFLLNGTGNMTVTKITILQEGGGVTPQPEGEKVSIIDQFVNTWSAEENYSVNGDGSITFNAVAWGGLAAWLAPEGVLSDWTQYSKLVFEFENNPVPVAVQGFVQCLDNDNAEVNSTWWGNAGITKLECPFEGKDMSRVQQAALQVSDVATVIITAIYLVRDVNGIEETVALTKNVNVNAPIYNLAGVRVNKDYKGIVIQNGRKFIQK